MPGSPAGSWTSWLPPSVVLDESDAVVLANSAACALGLVRGRGWPSRPPQDGPGRAHGRQPPGRHRLPGDLGRRTAAMACTASGCTRPRPPPGQVALVLEDLTEARRIEAVRRDFVANVSHELKTPVGALTLLAEAIERASDDPEAVQRFAGRMQIEAARLDHLVQELIDLSRVQNDDPLPEPVPVERRWSPRPSTAAAQAGPSRSHRRRRPAGPLVRGRGGQLAAALGNLVENAVNYAPGRTRIAVAARCRRASSRSP